MNERQLGTTLAALRLWQRETDWEARQTGEVGEWYDRIGPNLGDIATSEGAFEPLDDEEIDALCELLNMAERQPRIVLEIWNDIVDKMYSNIACELLVIHRDKNADSMLPDGDQGYSTILEATDEHAAEVRDAFERYG